jgi:hypothetical protein
MGSIKTKLKMNLQQVQCLFFEWKMKDDKDKSSANLN